MEQVFVYENEEKQRRFLEFINTQGKMMFEKEEENAKRLEKARQVLKESEEQSLKEQLKAQKKATKKTKSKYPSLGATTEPRLLHKVTFTSREYEAEYLRQTFTHFDCCNELPKDSNAIIDWSYNLEASIKEIESMGYVVDIDYNADCSDDCGLEYSEMSFSILRKES